MLVLKLLNYMRTNTKPCEADLRADESNIHPFRALTAVLLIFATLGLVFSFIVSKKLNDVAKLSSTGENQPPLFFYDKIGSTPSFQNASKLDFDPVAKYTVEIGYSKSRRGAEKTIDRLNAMGFPGFLTPVQLKTGKVIYRVRMGIFVNKEQAKIASNTLEDRTKFKGKLIALN